MSRYPKKFAGKCPVARCREFMPDRGPPMCHFHFSCSSPELRDQWWGAFGDDMLQKKLRVELIKSANAYELETEKKAL
jgi:hypothetical protein